MRTCWVPDKKARITIIKTDYSVGENNRNNINCIVRRGAAVWKFRAKVPLSKLRPGGGKHSFRDTFTGVAESVHPGEITLDAKTVMGE